MLDSDGNVVMYTNARESLYKNIDEIECVLGLKGDPKQARKALRKMKQTTE